MFVSLMLGAQTWSGLMDFVHLMTVLSSPSYLCHLHSQEHRCTELLPGCICVNVYLHTYVYHLNHHIHVLFLNKRIA